MQIVLLLVVILLVLLIFAAKGDSLTLRNKLMLLSSILLVILLAYGYEFTFAKKGEENRAVMNAFKQGKTVVCDGHDVNSTNFILITGTLSFTAKEENKKLRGVIYSVESCTLK